ncbi:Ig-like domain-containing protein [Mycolicibacterium parafortuitum]|uniref:Structural toxin [Chromobacterium violaceum ATCC] n=1 Tax=Mycolicibacterium parafortuitum TaxID=39692 RepID=A0A375YRK7_MYCPF|nr:Ig-like domain-containing protein [Mycolicibacterium parafortuitum]ORB29486.1 hypothetical protein BST38_14680 [Mycolicibacterium parafortuitum]SRX83659.1 structural toxin [Chromobacterium violaceum ATCC] [Mycolicibacterium parafortuitum]
MAQANRAGQLGNASARRAESFAVRRWLATGAASVGMGAALLGLSLTDSQIGVATAESSDTSSSVSPSDSNSVSSDTDTGTEDDGSASGADDPDADDPEADVDELEVDEGDIDEGIAEDIAEDEEPETRQVPARSRSHAKVAVTAAPDAERADAPDEDSSDPIVDSPAPTPVVTPAGTSTPWDALAERRQQSAAKAITEFMAAAQTWIAALPVDDPAKQNLTVALTFIRNTFFNQDPVLDPVQISGQLDGPVTGTINAVDPEGDPITMRLNRRPQYGTVALNPDGTYTYTPGQGFTGVDTFSVTAIDRGAHVNLLDLVGRPGTTTGILVNQGALKFLFTYEGEAVWTDEARAALQTGADSLARYFMVTTPVTLTIKAVGQNTGFASATSPSVSESAGFHRTVVQNKILTGRDSNGDEFDGDIDFNLSAAWSFTSEIAADEYDFVGTAMHELLHTFGFDASIGPAGKNTQRTWTIFDSFVVTAGGVRTVDRRRYEWNSAFDPNLTGGNGGLFFGGANAVAANNGNLVPLLTVNPWDGGSSVTHLDDRFYTGDNLMMMNAYLPEGIAVRVLSPIERGILKDLGYRVA